MKIKINYDFIQKISEGNKGFSLKRTGIKIFGFTSTIMFYRAIAFPERKMNFPVECFSLIAFYTAVFGMLDVLCSKERKNKAIESLEILSQDLTMIDVNTNQDLLLKARKYKTDYKISFDDFYFPKLEQKKYIMVPILDNEKEKEASLVQKHIIGTDDYDISQGVPKKLLKLPFNKK